MISLLTPLFEYPGPEFDAHLMAAERIAPDFVCEMRSVSAEEREELFSATFDIHPPCVLYVGIHLFGEENFKRGELMAALSARYEEVGFITTNDLPDHLVNTLRFLAYADEPEKKELVEFCLLAPLQKMIISLDVTNPYHHLLKAVQAALKEAWPGIQPAHSSLHQIALCSSSGCSSCGSATETLKAYG